LDVVDLGILLLENISKRSLVPAKVRE